MTKVHKSDKFPKMQVSLYDAPANPRQIIAFSYLECIEDMKLSSPSCITMPEATKITEWVLKGGHTPSLESINLCFNIRGISRVVSHQLVRHRIGVSIDQKTQRANSKEYLGQIFDGKHYVLPPSIDALPITEKPDCIWCNIDDYLRTAQMLYLELLNRGISEDDARYIIPQCAETAMNFKVIYKALQHIASVRLCRLMQGEIIEIVRLMVDCVREYDELLGQYLVPNCFISGRCNRNENNPNNDNPRGVCEYTQNGTVRGRKEDSTFDLTKFSRDNAK